ncbi:MAG: peptide chain release factor-like protein [Nitrospirales bacterium]|nr:peptide chain release factor-like protein [Nitrospirales bacterium]
MLVFAVSEEKNRWLAQKMRELGISEGDLEEKFVRSSGKGGQHVNKTSTCVHLRHLPTGLEVKCMQDRSQSVNRFLARRELIGKIERLSGHAAPGELKQKKIRKQKARSRRRSRTKQEVQEGEAE